MEKSEQINALKEFHKKFLRIPYENVTLYFRKRPPTIEEIVKDIKTGFGGDCITLARYAKHLLESQGLQSKIIHFYDNSKVNLKKDIKRNILDKYHTALVVGIGDELYFLDYGFQIDIPILLKDGNEVVSHLKSIQINLNRNGDLLVSRKTHNKDYGTIEANVNVNWTDKETLFHSKNTIFKDLPLRWSKLKGNGKIGFIQKGRTGEVIERYDGSRTVLFSGSVIECANYLELNPEIFITAYQNRMNLK